MAELRYSQTILLRFTLILFDSNWDGKLTSKEQRVMSNEQRAENKQQPGKGKEQKVTSNKQKVAGKSK